MVLSHHPGVCESWYEVVFGHIPRCFVLELWQIALIEICSFFWCFKTMVRRGCEKQKSGKSRLEQSLMSKESVKIHQGHNQSLRS